MRQPTSMISETGRLTQSEFAIDNGWQRALAKRPRFEAQSAAFPFSFRFLSKVRPFSVHPETAHPGFLQSLLATGGEFLEVLPQAGDNAASAPLNLGAKGFAISLARLPSCLSG